jgi:hypothetical protein
MPQAASQAAQEQTLANLWESTPAAGEPEKFTVSGFRHLTV